MRGKLTWLALVVALMVPAALAWAGGDKQGAAPAEKAGGCCCCCRDQACPKP
jgi:hypothetical protein